MSCALYLLWKETAPGSDEYLSQVFEASEYRKMCSKVKSELKHVKVAAFVTTARSCVLKCWNVEFTKRWRTRLAKGCLKQLEQPRTPLSGGLDF